MGKIKFGNSPSSISADVIKFTQQEVDTLLCTTVDAVVKLDNPQATMLPSPMQYLEVEKIVYVPQIKEVPVETIKYVNVEVIKEVPVIIEKVVVVEKESTPTIITKEVIVEKEIEVKNEINTILIYVIALSLLVNVLQGLL